EGLAAAAGGGRPGGGEADGIGGDFNRSGGNGGARPASSPRGESSLDGRQENGASRGEVEVSETDGDHGFDAGAALAEVVRDVAGGQRHVELVAALRAPDVQSDGPRDRQAPGGVRVARARDVHGGLRGPGDAIPAGREETR